MYARQMLCLVTTAFAPNVERVIDQARARLNAALRNLKFVHFASIALLPAQTGGVAEPSLMLELVIDQGLEPKQAVSQLVDADPETLWRLYFDGEAPQDAEPMRQALCDKLLALVKVAQAGGGFVGMRDRTATQVRAEALYFLAARHAMRQLRDDARAAGEQPSQSLLVLRLAAVLAQDPGHAAMHSAPPRSFWCRPRSFGWQLFLALNWLVLPMPFLVVVLATAGAIFDAGYTALPSEARFFWLIASATLLLLFAVFALVGLLRLGSLSMSILIVISSALGVTAAYVLLVGNTVRVGGFGGRGIGPADLIAAAVALVLVVAGWSIVHRPAAKSFRHVALRTASLSGAAAVVLMIGTILNKGLPAPPFEEPWRLLYFAVPAFVVMALFFRSIVVRRMLAVAWVIVPALLLPALASPQWGHTLATAWQLHELLAYVILGLLAHLSLALLVAVLVSARALSLVRAPWWPLGIPLLGLTALLVATAVSIGFAGIWVYEALCLGSDNAVPASGQPAGVIYSLMLALALALAAAVVWAARLLTGKALPALDARWRNFDRAQPVADDFRPCQVADAILANEAALFGRPNHLISLVDVRGRPGGWAEHMLRLWLYIIGQAGHVWYTRGLLGNAWGIKYAHWHVLDGGRRLVFISNFDGDFGGYLDEFIQGCSQGINLIWRWTELRPRSAAAAGQPAVLAGDERPFPKTYQWAFRGCHQEQHFKAFARASMLPHLYLFQAYDKSNFDIRRATRLREAMASARTSANDDLVLRILES